VSARGAAPLSACLVICSLWLLSCAHAVKTQEEAVLTLKRDGSHFYGTVVRRDVGSITVTGTSGDVHTFLMADLSDIHLSKAGGTTPPVDEPRAPTPLPTGGDLFEQPQGTQFAIRSNGFLDSCCLRLNDIELGVLDADIKSPNGVVLIPKGANVTFMVKDQENTGGRLSMTFELSSADYGGHHYMITSGAVMTVTGEKDTVAYTGAAAARGKSIHLEDNSAMPFKAATPITFKLST
jgi:hypothetical protein